MPSFCTIPPQAVAGLAPDQMSPVRHVPPQMEMLNQLIQKVKFELAGTPDGPAPVLGGPVPPGGGGAVPLAPPVPLQVPAALQPTRPDFQLAPVLPNMSPEQWMLQAFKVVAPKVLLPTKMPDGPGPLLAQAMKLALSAGAFPIGDPPALIKDIQDTLHCLGAGPGQAAKALQVLDTPDFTRMTQAARATLALREEGICPLDLAGVDQQFREAEGLDPARPKYQEFMAQAQQQRPAPMPFAMTAPQVDLANHFAALAPLADLPEKTGLPDLTDAGFIPELQKLLGGLAAVPAPQPAPALGPILSMAQKIEATDTIKKAFGDDALTPEGTQRVNAMLDFMARLQLPQPETPAVVLQKQLATVPPYEKVQKGAEIARTAGPALAASAAAAPPQIPVDPLLGAFNALAAVMQNALGIDPAAPPGADPNDLLKAAQAPKTPKTPSAPAVG